MEFLCHKCIFFDIYQKLSTFTNLVIELPQQALTVKIHFPIRDVASHIWSWYVSFVVTQKTHQNFVFKPLRTSVKQKCSRNDFS